MKSSIRVSICSVVLLLFSPFKTQQFAFRKELIVDHDESNKFFDQYDIVPHQVELVRVLIHLKCKRNSHSAMGAEACTLATAFDDAHALMAGLETFLGRTLSPGRLVTIVSRGTRLTA